jgi:hypothetical protein
MEEYRHLKGVKTINLHDQNRRKADTLRMSRFKMKADSGWVRKTEGDEVDLQKRVFSNNRTLSKNDSPIGLSNRPLFKSKNSKRKVNLSDETNKFRTLAIPHLHKSK